MSLSVKGKRKAAYYIGKTLQRTLIAAFIVLQLQGLFFLLLPSEKARAASLSVVNSASENLQSTTSTTYVDTDTTIASGSLPAGTYFVAWGAAAANSSISASSRVRLVRGSTEIAATSVEGSVASTLANTGIARSGYWLGTLNGSEALTIQYNSSLGSASTRIDSKFIKAIRLDTNLVADADYFTSGSQEAGTDEVANATTASFTDVKALTKSFGTGIEDYLVLASLEFTPDSTTNDCNTRLEVDGVAAMTSTMEGENAGDQFSYATAKVFSIGSGSKTIKLQGQSVGTATCDFLRSRIYVFRASIFDQLVENYSSGESTLASATWADKNSQAYTPNQSETVMMIGSRALGTNSTACSVATRIDNGTAQFADTNSFNPNNATADYAIGMSAASQTVSSATTFKVQYQRPTGTCTVKIKESTLIIWSMTLEPAALKQSAYRWFSASSSATSGWCNDTTGVTCTSAWTNRRKITINNAASATNLTDYPLLIKLNSSRIDYSKTQSAGQDIRFVDPSDATTVLPHEIEEFNETGDDYIWVKVPQIDSGSTTDYIWMYYGNAGIGDGQAATSVWDSNYRMVQHLEETAACSVTFTDSTTNANNGACNGSGPIAAAAGKIDGAREFDGSSQYVSLTHATSQNVTNGTFQAWINRDELAQFHFIMEKGVDDDDAYSLYVDDANHVTFHYRDTGAQDRTHVDTATTISANTWHLITATFDDTNNTFKIYVNGSQTFTVSDSNSLKTSLDQLRIGAESFFGVTAHMDGKLDDVRISSSARSADWIEADFLSGSDSMNSFGAEESAVAETFTPLAAQDTAYTLTSAGQIFRLRMLLHVSGNFLVAGDQTLKLQYAVKSGTCDVAYSGETYGDVGTASGDIRYNDVTGFSDGGAMTPDAADPTHGGDTVTPQTYEEANDFTSISRIDSGADGKWDFSLVDFSAPANTSYCFRVVTSGGSVIGTPDVVPELTSFGSNTAPSSPTSLVQQKTDDTVLATGAWTNETSIKLTATVTDSDGGDTIKICAEVDPITTAFSSPAGDGDGCSVTGVSTGNTATVTISGLSADTEYHWQIKAKDAAGAYSSWVTYGGNTENPPTNPAARDFGTDPTAPTGGTVFDGTSVGVDATFNDGSLSVMSANWSGFSADVSGLLRYDYSIGTTAGATDIKAWTANGTTTSVTATSLTLKTSQLYFVNVRAVDNAGNVQTAVSSNGQMVAPNLSFTVSPTALTFANLNAANAYTDSKATTLTTSTNAFNGYVVRLAATDFLRSGSFIIPDFSGGTYALPDSWQGGDTGFGYTSSDTLVQGANKFQSATCPGGSTLAAPGCFAPYSQIKPGDIVADNTAPVTASPVTITHRVTSSATQAAQSYAVVLIYAITALY